MTLHTILLCLFAALPVLSLALAADKSQASPFTAKSVTQTGTIHLNGAIHRVFPFFGPVREKEWAPGWNPQIVFPIGPEIAEGMVFTVQQDKNGIAYWMVTRFDPATHTIAYANVIPGLLAVRIQIACRAAGDQQTDVTVTYQHTALSDAGNQIVEQLDDKASEAKMAHWQHAINHLLATGKRIPSEH